MKKLCLCLDMMEICHQRSKRLSHKINIFEKFSDEACGVTKFFQKLLIRGTTCKHTLFFPTLAHCVICKNIIRYACMHRDLKEKFNQSFLGSKKKVTNALNMPGNIAFPLISAIFRILIYVYSMYTSVRTYQHEK